MLKNRFERIKIDNFDILKLIFTSQNIEKHMLDTFLINHI